MYVAAMIRGQTIARNYANPVAVARCLEKKKKEKKGKRLKRERVRRNESEENERTKKGERKRERQRVEEVLLAQHRELALTDG